MYLSTRARTAVLLRVLHSRNFSLLEGPFYFNATAFYKVVVGFLFGFLYSFKVLREKGKYK